MSEFTVISPAMFNLYKECELKFYYKYIEQVSAPVLEANFVEGKNIHALASYFLRGFNVEKYEAQLSKNEESYWSYLKQTKYFGFEIVGIEHQLSMRVGNYWIGGRLDAIVKNNEDYYILDYKTGGVNSDKTYDFQTMVYLLLCDEVFKERTSLSFVYLDLRNKKEVIIPFSQTLKIEYFDRIKTTCAGMSKINKTKTVCTEFNCPYSKLCTVSNY